MRVSKRPMKKLWNGVKKWKLKWESIHTFFKSLSSIIMLCFSIQSPGMSQVKVENPSHSRFLRSYLIYRFLRSLNSISNVVLTSDPKEFHQIRTSDEILEIFSRCYFIYGVLRFQLTSASDFGILQIAYHQTGSNPNYNKYVKLLYYIQNLENL